MKIKSIRRTARALLLALSAPICAGAAAQTGPQPPLPTVRLTAGGMHVIQAEIAQSQQERATGMMFRTEMGANAGMLLHDGPLVGIETPRFVQDMVRRADLEPEPVRGDVRGWAEAVLARG